MDGKVDFNEILDIELEENDAEAKTIREYLKALAYAVIYEVEGFSGKRPFGNSDWIWDLIEPIKNKYDLTDDGARYVLENTVKEWSWNNER